MEEFKYTDYSLKEIMEFWSKLKESEEVKEEDFKDNQQYLYYWAAAKTIESNNSLRRLFFLTETDYSKEKYEDLVKRVENSAYMAEYLNIKFDSEDKLLTLLFFIEPEAQKLGITGDA